MQVLLLQELAPDARQWLEARHTVNYRPELLQDPALLHEQLARVHALVAPPTLMVNNTLLDKAPQLAALGRLHDGLENIDYEACMRHCVRVIQMPEAMVRAKAEFLLLQLMAQFRYGGQAPGAQRPGREINDRVVGLLGLTPVAQILVTMLQPLGVRVMGYDPALHRSAEIWQRLGVQPMALHAMLETADAISVQMVHAQRYQRLLGERVLGACKPGQVWVSVSRPQLFDLPVLADTLRSGQMAYCALDSDDPALHAPDSPLAGLPNLHITPGLAGDTHEARLRASWFLADRIHEALESARPYLDSDLPAEATP